MSALFTAHGGRPSYNHPKSPCTSTRLKLNPHCLQGTLRQADMSCQSVASFEESSLLQGLGMTWEL